MKSENNDALKKQKLIKLSKILEVVALIFIVASMIGVLYFTFSTVNLKIELKSVIYDPTIEVDYIKQYEDKINKNLVKSVFCFLSLVFVAIPLDTLSAHILKNNKEEPSELKEEANV